MIITVPVIKIVLIPMEVICASVKMVSKKFHLMTSVKVHTLNFIRSASYKLYIREKCDILNKPYMELATYLYCPLSIFR